LQTKNEYFGLQVGAKNLAHITTTLLYHTKARLCQKQL
jgi:hypothetical protein